MHVQIANLAAYIAGTGPLQWPVPQQREIAGNFRLQLQLLTHRRCGRLAGGGVGGGGMAVVVVVIRNAGGWLTVD